MRKIAVAVIAILVAGIVFIAGQSYIEKQKWLEGVNKIDEWSIIEGNEYNSGLGDIVIGEYADFQCSACAITFPYIHEVIKEYGDEVAYTYRIYTLSYHSNATAAATAALAASKQGYFEDFALMLFDKQDDWFYSEGEQRDKQFESYLENVSDGHANMDKYREDLKSKDIKDKIALDHELAVRSNLTGTPLIFINKERFDVTSSKESEFKKELKSRIDAAIEAANKE
jgi:protein-disulfide isomerase